ncbi:tryptophan synthase subunit alpha [Reichenbachiella sp. MALMAid0571]|uniref:tryptophan synthase subunit alpha n=1 Tax=Reichenbachiella sp. MALMAid0571 TaxID=3143939 RepID=UPI0032E04B04
MNRINNLLENKSNILTIFFTAGYPNLTDTIPVLEKLQAEGVDMIEIGIPFSDPVADGPVIQQSNLQAIENGMTVKLLFEQLQGMRKKITIPVVIMSSLNPTLQYGMEAFCEQCKQVGIDGLILPDLPIDVYQSEYKTMFDTYGIHNILLITPTTSASRIKTIDEQSTGFIYLVSSSSITGSKGQFSEEQLAYFKRMKSLELSTPMLIGFGISDNNTFNEVCQYSKGGIIGSAFVNALKEEGSLDQRISNFIQEIRPN